MLARTPSPLLVPLERDKALESEHKSFGCPTYIQAYILPLNYTQTDRSSAGLLPSFHGLTEMYLTLTPCALTYFPFILHLYVQFPLQHPFLSIANHRERFLDWDPVSEPGQVSNTRLLPASNE
jgi:hypothetical protein